VNFDPSNVWNDNSLAAKFVLPDGKDVPLDGFNKVNAMVLLFPYGVKTGFQCAASTPVILEL